MNARELLAAIPLANRPRYAAQLGITLDAKGEPTRAWTEADRADAADVCDGVDAIKAERDLQKLWDMELKRRDIPAHHLSCRAREQKGWPDSVFPHPFDAVFCAVEIKWGKGQLRKEQAAILARFEAIGARVLVMRSFEQGIKFLERKDWKRGKDGWE